MTRIDMCLGPIHICSVYCHALPGVLPVTVEPVSPVVVSWLASRLIITRILIIISIIRRSKECRVRNNQSRQNKMNPRGTERYKQTQRQRQRGRKRGEERRRARGGGRPKPRCLHAHQHRSMLPHRTMHRPRGPNEGNELDHASLA